MQSLSHPPTDRARPSLAQDTSFSLDSMSALVFREAALSEVESKSDWHNFDFSSNGDDFNAALASGGGFSYKYSDSPRFIIWRAVSGGLDLIEYSLKGTLLGNAVRLTFGQNIVPNVMFHEILTETEGVLVMVVVMYSQSTSKSSLKRFVLPHPRFMENPLQTSIFASSVEESLELAIDNDLNLVTKEVPVVCELIDEMNVYIGCFSGAIVHVQLEPLNEAHAFVEVVVRESGALLNTLRGLIPLGGKRQAPSVVGLAVFINDLVFALYDDAKLRVWSSRRNNSLILSLPIPIEAWNPETPNTTSKWSLKLLPQSDDVNTSEQDAHDASHYDFKLGIYVSMSGDSQVQIYHGTVDRASGGVSLQMEGVSYYGNDRLIDFALSTGQSATIDEDWVHPRVWGLWHGLQPEDGDYVLAHTQTSRSALHTGGAGASSSCLEVNNWTEANLENPSIGLDSLVTPNPVTHHSLAESFLSHILQPGRFSSSMIVRALESFTDAEIVRSQPSSTRELKAIVAYELRREVQHRQEAQGLQNAHQSWRTAHSTWTQFLELCIQVWKEDHTPLSLFCVPNSCGLVLIVKLGQISVLREASPLESLRLLSVRSRPLSQYALLSSFSSIASSTASPLDISLGLARNPRGAISGPRKLSSAKLPITNTNLVAEIFKALDVMSLITSQLGSAKLELFEQRLFNLTDPVASASCDVEFLCGSPMEPQMTHVEALLAEDTMSTDERIARRSFMNRLIRSARAIARVDVCMEQLFGLIEASIHGPHVQRGNGASAIYPELKSANNPFSSELLDSELFEDVLARAFSQSVTSGFDLLRDSMYLGLLCIRTELQLNLSSTVLKNLHSLLPRIAEQLKAYHALKWFSMQYVTGNPIEPDIDLPMRRLGPKLAADATMLRQRLGSAPITAIRLYIMDIRSEVSGEYDERAWRAISNILPVLIHLVHPLSVLGDKCSVTNQLLFRGQHLSLFEYVRLLNSKSAYHRDLLGDCYLALAQYEKAMECFVQASINIELETNEDPRTWPPMTSSLSMNLNLTRKEQLSVQNPLVHSVRQALGRDRHEKESLGLYYWKALIPDLEAQRMHDLVIKAANCALSCTHASDETTFSMLYLAIFKASLAIEYHEQAYAAMIHITEDARRMEALSEFVLFFIERGKARELAELPFVNMLDQFHQIIMNRAKSTEIIQPQPNLYQVLYAFHIAKSNYRLAAACMFVYADRLSVEHHVGLAVLERYSAAILAVLTALKLIDPPHAYLTTHRSTSSSATGSPAKRPRDDIASDIHSLSLETHSMQNHKDMQALRHVEVYDIPRLELMHLLAQCNLKLARKNRTLALTGLKSPSSTLSLLLEHMEFSLAYRLAHASKLKMDDIFSRHTLYCLSLPTSSATTEAKRWGDLRTHLNTYDSTTTNFHYHFVVADTIFSTDHRISLPIWLIYTFKTGSIAPVSISHSSDHHEVQSALEPVQSISDKNMQLMMLYLKHSLIEDAAKLASEMILRASLKLEAYTDTSAPFQSILPYQHIEQVLAHLQNSNTQLHAKVAAALKHHLDLAVDKQNLKIDQQAE